MTDNTLLEKICSICGLGELLAEPEPLTGGYMHRMYSLRTDTGRYAVKLLNPFIMERPDAIDNFLAADRLEAVLENGGIPIVPAISFGGKKMQCIGGRYFYVYGYFEGTALKDHEITVSHCRRIGEVLARIHSLDRRDTGFEPDVPYTDWDGYISRLRGEHDELYRLLADNRDLLYESMEKGSAAMKKLPKATAVCHNDMDSKNVLWQGSEFRLIDLECLGHSSPVMEAYDLALCWSGYEGCALDTKKFEAFLGAYIKSGGQLSADPETLYHSSCGRLEWLEYNVKKSLGEECGEDEISSAQAQVRETMAHVIYYHSIKDMLTESLDRIGRYG